MAPYQLAEKTQGLFAAGNVSRLVSIPVKTISKEKREHTNGYTTTPEVDHYGLPRRR